MITIRKPVHPGVVLREDVIKPLKLSITTVAKDLGVSRKALSELVNGRTSLSPMMAVRIGRATRTSPESWLNMQTKVDIWLAEKEKTGVGPFLLAKAG